MKVRELLEELKDIDPEREVYMSYTETGGCCCNSYQDTEEVAVTSITQTKVTDWMYKGRKRVNSVKDVVMLSEY